MKHLLLFFNDRYKYLHIKNNEDLSRSHKPDYDIYDIRTTLYKNLVAKILSFTYIPVNYCHLIGKPEALFSILRLLVVCYQIH